jgi:hypothetical protein
MLLTAGSLSFSSCEDYLTITPTDRIVEEEFWEDKNDLKNALTACYRRMIENDMMKKYILWGEVRSDNFELTTGVTATNITNLMNANLLSTNNIFTWTCFYNLINYCNKILVRGPEIVQKDESFSNGDWLPMRAEAITLRAFAHYYLVRTFGEVPYVTTEYNNDGQDFLIGQSTQIEVLDNIISDLESVKDQAMIDYGNTSDNKGRITRKAVYTMLADVYLWRACYKEGNSEIAEASQTTAADDYQKCVDCCNYVINTMTNDYIEDLNKNGKVLGGVTAEDIRLEDLFIQNVSTNSKISTVSRSSLGAFNSIFGSGNSRESIFELQFDGTTNINSMELEYFWNARESKAGTFECASALISAVETNPSAAIPASIFTKTDYRRWETARFTKADQTEYPLAKYNYRLIDQYNGTSSSGMRDNTLTTFKMEGSLQGVTNSANWIVYRLSDVVLMKAEALTQLSSDEESLQEPFSLVREVFKRSNPYAYQNATSSADSLRFDNYSTRESMNQLILNERQREFIGEGKRWFDLVRYAQRDGSTVNMLKFLSRKFIDNQNAIKAKLASMKSLFSPIHTNEIKNNSLLHQNEVWGTSENTSRTDDM